MVDSREQAPMATGTPAHFAPRGSATEVEAGAVFQPNFDAAGLIGAIVTEAGSGEVLMFAWMNEAALRASLETGVAHFWSRSRNKLWRKGEESGNELAITEIRTDCDQDVLLVQARLNGAGVACHTGSKSCFYRTLILAPDGATVMLQRTGG